jgi:hypothetical protein
MIGLKNEETIETGYNEQKASQSLDFAPGEFTLYRNGEHSDALICMTIYDGKHLLLLLLEH